MFWRSHFYAATVRRRHLGRIVRISNGWNRHRNWTGWTEPLARMAILLWWINAGCWSYFANGDTPANASYPENQVLQNNCKPACFWRWTCWNTGEGYLSLCSSEGDRQLFEMLMIQFLSCTKKIFYFFHEKYWTNISGKCILLYIFAPENILIKWILK